MKDFVIRTEQVQVSTLQVTGEICMQTYINMKPGTRTHHVHGYNPSPAITNVLSMSEVSTWTKN